MFSLLTAQDLELAPHTTNDQMQALARATGREADVLYCQLVLRHHLGGIHMVDGRLQLSDRPEVVRLATTMKNGQQLEITNLTAMLEDLGAGPL